MKHKAIALALAAVAAGCSQPDQAMTEKSLQDAIAEQDDYTNLKNTYHIIKDEDDRQIGVAYIEDVTRDDKSNSTCIIYNTYTSQGDLRGLESEDKKLCVHSSDLKLK